MLGAGHSAASRHPLPPLPAVADSRASTAGHAAAQHLGPRCRPYDNGAMEAKPKRRWYQYRLRTLMIVVTLLAVPLGYVGWQKDRAGGSPPVGTRGFLVEASD